MITSVYFIFICFIVVFYTISEMIKNLKLSETFKATKIKIILYAQKFVYFHPGCKEAKNIVSYHKQEPQPS